MVKDYFIEKRKWLFKTYYSLVSVHDNGEYYTLCHCEDLDAAQTLYSLLKTIHLMYEDKAKKLEVPKDSWPKLNERWVNKKNKEEYRTISTVEDCTNSRAGLYTVNYFKDDNFYSRELREFLEKFEKVG